MIERLLALLIADLGESEAVEQHSGFEWSIHLDGNIEILLRISDNKLLFSTLIGDIPESVQILEDMLAASCLGVGTLGGALCSSGDKKVYLKRETPSLLSYRNFFAVLEDIATAAFFWKTKLK